jgi:ammonium transporter, Amt family
MRNFDFLTGGHTFMVRCSIGITLVDSSPTTITDLLSQADTACHQAKNEGRDCFKLYREIAPEEILHLEGVGLKEQIERALGEERFTLSFLPVKDCATSTIRAFETLIQMQSHQEIPVRAFLIAAERFDLAPRIDRWVIDQALRQFSACNNANLSISVNLSGRTLQQEDLIEYIRGRLAEYQLNPDRLTFEIAERTALASVTQTKHFMEKVKDLGCGLALDDFGVSLNSINLLRHLPVNQLKIEAGLISSVRSSPFNQAVISSIVGIARELDIETVAKGVVRDDEGAELCRLGVNLLQGQEIEDCCRKLPSLGA